MVVYVIGKKYGERKNKNTNQPYGFFNVSVIYREDGYDGYKSEELFLTVERLQGCVPLEGKFYNIEYNRWGSIGSFNLSASDFKLPEFYGAKPEGKTNENGTAK